MLKYPLPIIRCSDIIAAEGDIVKIGFTTDTNMLHKSEQELFNGSETLNSMDIFTDYVSSLEKSKSDKELIYYLPRTVIDELKYQKVLAFNKSYNDFETKYNNLNYGLIGKLPKKNIEEVIDKEIDGKKDKVKILNLEYSESLFSELVDEAIKKEPPFDKSLYGKKTDAGFKDSLIWKTILYSKEIDNCDKFYFCSGDNIFDDNKEKFCKEFKKFHKKTNFELICFDQDDTKRQNCLQKIISDNELYETDVIKLYDEKLILNDIVNLKYEFDSNACYYSNEKQIFPKIILFNKFDKDDFYIKNVDKHDDIYKVSIEFKTLKYNANNVETEPDDIVYGNIKLIYEKSSKNSFKLLNSHVSDVRFNEYNYSEVLSKILINMYNNGYKEMIENISNYLKNSVDPVSPAIKEAMKNISEYNSMINAFTNSLNKNYNNKNLP